MIQRPHQTQRVLSLGMIASGLTIAISSFGIVRAEHAKPNGSVSYSCSSGTACVEGDSTGSATWGVYGLSTMDDAVHGVTSSTNGNSAVAGIATGTSGFAHGVYGKSSNGDGVYGASSSAYGVEGTSTATNLAGVHGYSKTADGIIAESDAGGYYALFAQADTASTYIFYGLNLSSGDSCTIDNLANLTCSGSIQGSVVRTRHRNSGGQHVLTYASESATATVEDVGTARMIGGVANVQISPDFAAVMDHKWYYVFLTPLGDTRGLYVSMKTPAAFQVRETEHGRSSLEFDYRIVAHPLDAKSDRLPEAPPVERPRGIQPTH